MRSEGEDHGPPGGIAAEELAGDGQDAPDAGLGQRAGKEGRGRGRGDRMGLRQPDMEGEHARLRAEAKEDAGSRRIEHGPLARRLRRGIEGVELQGPQPGVEKEDSHQGDEAADDGNGQIGLGRADRPRRLLLDHPGEGGEGHDLKEDEGRIEIGGQEDAHRCAEGQELEEIVSVAVVVMGEIIGRKEQGHRPHEGEHQTVDRAEAVVFQAQAETADPAELRREIGARGGTEEVRRKGQCKLNEADADRQRVSSALRPPPNHPSDRRCRHREENHQQ